MAFEIKGKVIEVGPVEQVTDSFKKRILVVEFATNPQYPEEIKFETVQDKVSMLDNIYPGDDVEVSFNIRGRKYTSKTRTTDWFNTLQPWRINKVSGSSQPAASPASTPPPAVPDLPPPSADDEEDSLF